MSKDYKVLKGDIFGGLTAGIVALPLTLAFGVAAFAQVEELSDNFDPQMLSVIGAKAGLYGAMFLCIFTSIFGGTNTQISGPTAPMTVLSKGVIFSAFAAVMATMTSVENPNLEDVLALAFPVILVTFIFAGIFQMIFGFISVGKLIDFMPHSVVSGFMSGIGVIIIIGQIFPFFGKTNPASSFQTLTSLGSLFEGMNWWALLLAGLTLVIIYVMPRFTKVVPSSLAALVIVTLVSTYLLPTNAVAVIGEIPTGIPVPHLSAITQFDWLNTEIWKIVIPSALTLAALASIDSLLTSVIADNLTKTKHDSNKELIGQGLGNMVSGFFGGLPGAGATVRTVVNINTGGTTKLSIGVTAIVLVFSVVAIGPLISVIPKPVLSGILLTVGIGIIDKKGLKALNKIPKGDAVVLLTVLSLTVFWDLIASVAVGVIISFAAFVKSTIEISRENSELKVWDDVQREQYWAKDIYVPMELQERFVVKHLTGPLFFGLASKFKTLTNKIPNVDFVIFRMDKVPYFDQSGIVALEDTLNTLKKRGIDFVFVGLKKQPEEMMRKSHMIPEMVTEGHLHPSFKSCMETMVGELELQPA